MCFDNEINATYKYSQTCLSELRSTGILTIRNKLLGTDFSLNVFNLLNSETSLSDTDSEI